MRTVYTKIDQIVGNVITVAASEISYRELAQVTSAPGTAQQRTSLAQVIRLEAGRVFLQVFAGARGISTDAEVRFLGRPMEVSFSDALLGRAIHVELDTVDGPRTLARLLE